MKRTPLRKISEKQKEKQRLWNEITNAKAKELFEMCQWCGIKGQREDSNRWGFLDGHHIILRSKGRVDTPENCYLCHRVCHSEIHLENIDVRIYKKEYEWRNRNDKTLETRRMAESS